MKNLLEAVNKVLNNREEADKILPSQSGFFFGGTDYDEYYFDDLLETKKMIEMIFKEKLNEELDIYYQASW